MYIQILDFLLSIYHGGRTFLHKQWYPFFFNSNMGPNPVLEINVLEVDRFQFDYFFYLDMNQDFRWVFMLLSGNFRFSGGFKIFQDNSSSSCSFYAHGFFFILLYSFLFFFLVFLFASFFAFVFLLFLFFDFFLRFWNSLDIS